jgi:hypothetical protein
MLMFFAIPILFTLVQDANEQPPAVAKVVNVSVEFTIIRQPSLAPKQAAQEERPMRYAELLERQHIFAMAVQTANLGKLKSFARVADPIEKIRQTVVVRVTKHTITLSCPCTDPKDGIAVVNGILDSLGRALEPKNMVAHVLDPVREHQAPPLR